MSELKYIIVENKKPIDIVLEQMHPHRRLIWKEYRKEFCKKVLEDDEDKIESFDLDIDACFEEAELGPLGSKQNPIRLELVGSYPFSALVYAITKQMDWDFHGICMDGVHKEASVHPILMTIGESVVKFMRDCSKERADMYQSLSFIDMQEPEIYLFEYDIRTEESVEVCGSSFCNVYLDKQNNRMLLDDDMTYPKYIELDMNTLKVIGEYDSGNDEIKVIKRGL